MSSSSRLQADVQEPKTDELSFIRPMENQYSEEFAKFKAAVDKDPFVAVFGKRLESPPSSNNSSWTSLFRIFEAVPTEDTPSAKSSPGPRMSSAMPHEKADMPKRSSTNPTSETPVARSTHFSSTTKPAVPSEEALYEFDPISMKKVPKKKVETQPPTKVEKQPFLSTLFAEHGVNIPVKTYKPHKVYGYTGKDESQGQSNKADEPTNSKKCTKKFESSRLQELQRLKATTLGNAVDASNFCGKYVAREPDIRKAVADMSKLSIDSGISADDAPLFSGTTYESKSRAILAARTAPGKDWLAEEGFRTSPSTTEPLSKIEKASTWSGTRTQPDTVSRIEPSLDRMKSSNAKDKLGESMSKQVTVSEPDSDKIEVFDPLSPNDTQIQVRSSRRTRQDADLNKRQARQRLEADYISRQQRSDEAFEEAEYPMAASARKIQDGLSSLWKRVQNQPQYANLANTIRNMGAFQDAWKKYSRDTIIEDPNQKLVFKDPNLSKAPSIYRKTAKRANKTLSTFTPSKEVLDAERESQTRTAVLRAANEQAKREEAERKRRDAELASEIRQAYETQYGPIDVNHRQVTSADKTASSAAADCQIKAVNESDKLQLPVSPMPSSNHLQSSPKPVVDGEKAIEAVDPQRDLGTLQPRIDHLVDEVKNTRKILHEVSLHIKAIKSRRPPTYWNTPVAEVLSETAGSVVAQIPSETPEQSKALPSVIYDSQETVEKSVAESFGKGALLNQSAARAQALREMRERRANQVQRKEELVQPLIPGSQVLPDSTVPKPGESNADRVNQVQACEKAAVEASAEALTQQKARDIKDNPSEEATNAFEAKPLKAAPVSSSSALGASSPIQQAPALYKILAYDSSTLQISTATTTSSIYPSTSSSGGVDPPLHPTEVLSRLNNPAKFLPYFQGLQDEGYEIISGSGDILVFKKVREDLTSTAIKEDPQMATTPIKQRDTPVQKEAATVLEEFPSKPAPAPPAPPSRPIVHRQEDVFSGSGKTWHQGGAQSQSTAGSEKPSEGLWYRIRRGARRIFFTGLATAGVVYGIGAVAESSGAQQQPLYEEEPIRRRGTRPGIYSTESSR